MDEQRFDSVTRQLARGTSRRQALRRGGGGLAGGVLAMLGLGRAAVRAQDAPGSPLCSQCRQCISMFLGECASACARSGQFEPEACPSACCEGSRTTCAVLGECTPACTALCPGD